MSATAFFQGLHQAFDQTVSRHAGQPVLAQALLHQAADSFHGNVAAQCEGEPALACRRGCASCCTLRVTATAPEVLALAAFLRAVQPALQARGIDLVAPLRAAEARTRGLDEAGRVALRQRCPFIVQGVCVVYAVRPLACRGHASQAVQACVEAAAGRRDEVPFSPGHRLLRSLVQGALQAALQRAGLAWGAYELNSALCLALDDPAADAAWRAGADPLAAAAVADGRPDEMQAVFAQLRAGDLAGREARFTSQPPAPGHQTCRPP